jgi:hypothetical protein
MVSLENIGKKTKIYKCSSALYDVSNNDYTPKARWR